MDKVNVPPTPKPIPKVVHTFNNLPPKKNYPNIEFRVRLVKYKTSPVMLDVRQYITHGKRYDGQTFSGYDSKGITLNLEQAKELFSRQDEILNYLQAALDGKLEVKDEEV